MRYPRFVEGTPCEAAVMLPPPGENVGEAISATIKTGTALTAASNAGDESLPEPRASRLASSTSRMFVGFRSSSRSSRLNRQIWRWGRGSSRD
jgi:hypothetical protein